MYIYIYFVCNLFYQRWFDNSLIFLFLLPSSGSGGMFYYSAQYDYSTLFFSFFLATAMKNG